MWLTLKNITTTIENKKFDAKQIIYTILENIKFHNFRFDTSPNICNVFHVDKLRAASTDFFFLKFQMITIQAQRLSVIKTARTNITSKKSWKKNRGYQYLIKWKNYARLTWEPVSVIKNIIALDEFESNFNWKKSNMMGWTYTVIWWFIELIWWLTQWGLIQCYLKLIDVWGRFGKLKHNHL